MEQRIGEYRLVERLTQLPAGTLVEANHPAERESLALLILPDDLSRPQQMWEALRREAAALRTVDHAGIVRLLDVEMIGTQLVVAYERPPGKALTTLLAGGAAFTVEQIAAQVQQIATVIAFVHRRGMAHGLLSPSAIFVAEDGAVSIVGLGLAVTCDEAGRTAAVRSRVEPGYLAPEQIDGELNQRTADGYGLGALAFTLLTGTPPAAPVEDADIADATTNGEPSTETLDLAGVLRRQLARDPTRRFATGLEFADALHRALGLVPAPPATLPTHRPGSRPADRQGVVDGSAPWSGDEPVGETLKSSRTEQQPPPRRPQRTLSALPRARLPAIQTEAATPAMLAAMRAERGSHVKVIPAILGLWVVILVAGRVTGGDWWMGLGIASVMTLAIAGAAIYSRRQISEDIANRTVVRVSASAVLKYDGRSSRATGHSITLADGRRLIIAEALYDTLRLSAVEVPYDGLVPSGLRSIWEYRTNSLTAVYTPSNGMLLEITNEAGETIYRDKQYVPQAP